MMHKTVVLPMWVALPIAVVATLKADQSFTGDVTVSGTVKARDVRVADGVLLTEKKMNAIRKEIVSQAVDEVLNTLRFRTTTVEVRAITEQITSSVLQALDRKHREESVSNRNSTSEMAALKRQVTDLESKYRDSERELSKLQREVEQLRRDLSQRLK